MTFKTRNSSDSSLRLIWACISSLDSLATSGVSGQETSSDGCVLSNSEVYTNRGAEADDLTYYKKRKRFGLVRVFSRGKKKSGELRGRNGRSVRKWSK